MGDGYTPSESGWDPYLKFKIYVFPVQALGTKNKFLNIFPENFLKNMIILVNFWKSF